MSRAARRQRFTLMEVLVAAVIFAGLSLALFAYASYATSAWQQLQLRRNQLDALLVIDRALAMADEAGVKGKNITPFLLAHIVELTGGDSLKTNIQLAYNNARAAARIAVALAKL